MNLRDFPAETYLQEHAQTTPRVLDVQAAIELALRNNAQIVYLRQAAEVARAEVGSALELRDPELLFGYGEGERSTDRTWLVPRSELAPLYSYPSPGLLISEDPAQLSRETDPRVPRALIPEGGQNNYLTTSSNRFSGTTMDSDSYKVGVRFFPPNPWIAAARRATYRAGYAAALADAYAVEWQVASRIKELYAWIAYLRLDLTLAQQLEEVRQTAAQTAFTLVDSGQMSTIEALTASQRHLQALSDCDKLERDAALAVSELSALLGRSFPAEAIQTGTNRPAPLEPAALESLELQRRTLKNRKEIAAAYWRSQFAEAALREARATRIPWFTNLEGSFGQSNRRKDPDAAWGMEGRTAELDPFYSIPIDEEQDTEWRVEAVVTLPIFSLGPQATRVQRAQYRQAMETLGALTRQALSETLDALARLTQTEARRAAFEADFAARQRRAQAALADLELHPDVAAEDLIRTKEMSVELERMRVRQEYDRQMAILRLEQKVGCELK